MYVVSWGLLYFQLHYWISCQLFSGVAVLFYIETFIHFPNNVRDCIDLVPVLADINPLPIKYKIIAQCDHSCILLVYEQHWACVLARFNTGLRRTLQARSNAVSKWGFIQSKKSLL